MFNDNMNNNQKFYRGIFVLLFILESEAFVKIQRDKAHLRSDESPENKTLYEPVVSPYTECDTHHQNNYRAE